MFTRKGIHCSLGRRIRFVLSSLTMIAIIVSTFLVLRAWPKFVSKEVVNHVKRGMQEGEVRRLVGDTTNICRYEDGSYYLVYEHFPYGVTAIEFGPDHVVLDISH